MTDTTDSTPCEYVQRASELALAADRAEESSEASARALLSIAHSLAAIADTLVNGSVGSRYTSDRPAVTEPPAAAPPVVLSPDAAEAFTAGWEAAIAAATQVLTHTPPKEES